MKDVQPPFSRPGVGAPRSSAPRAAERGGDRDEDHRNPDRLVPGNRTAGLIATTSNFDAE